MDIYERIQAIRSRHSPELVFYPPSVVVPNKIWIGSMWDARNTDWLYETGITHVINCASPLQSYKSSVMAKANIQSCLVLNTEDEESYEILKKPLEDVVEFCNQAFAQDPNAKLLFHCMAGVNRSAALSLAYASVGDFPDAPKLPRGERFVKAFESLMEVRPNILTNRGFYEQLLKWLEPSL